jgi:hypothetical protein
MKSSVKNDYATYRRAAQFLKVMADSQALQESQNLSMFLATQGKIRDTLKGKITSCQSKVKSLSDYYSEAHRTAIIVFLENLEKIRNYEDLFCDIINIALQVKYKKCF